MLHLMKEPSVQDLVCSFYSFVLQFFINKARICKSCDSCLYNWLTVLLWSARSKMNFSYFYSYVYLEFTNRYAITRKSSSFNCKETLLTNDRAISSITYDARRNNAIKVLFCFFFWLLLLLCLLLCLYRHFR